MVGEGERPVTGKLDLAHPVIQRMVEEGAHLATRARVVDQKPDVEIRCERADLFVDVWAR